MASRFPLVAAGVLLAAFMAGLDQTLVSTALASLGRELAPGSDPAGIVTAYLLCSTAALPPLGYLSDRIGGGKVLVFSLVVVAVAGVGTAVAGSLTAAVWTRGLQGVGAAGLIVGAQAVFADLVPARERGRLGGMVGAVLAAAAITGPVLGGLLPDAVGWRSVFVVNVPLATAAVVLVWPLLRTGSRGDQTPDGRGEPAPRASLRNSLTELRSRTVVLSTLATVGASVVMYPVVTYLPFRLQDQQGIDAVRPDATGRGPASTPVAHRYCFITNE